MYINKCKKSRYYDYCTKFITRGLKTILSCMYNILQDTNMSGLFTKKKKINLPKQQIDGFI